MTRIEHLAIWTWNLDRLQVFYETYFGAEAGARYLNADRDFESCFLSFSSGARLELMRVPGVEAGRDTSTVRAGYAHLALSVGSSERVDDLTARLQRDGYQVIDAPRTTGDGYYESVVSDPDGNWVEITI